MKWNHHCFLYSNMNNIGRGDKYDLMKFRLTELEISSCLLSFLDLFYSITFSGGGGGGGGRGSVY